MNGDLIELGIRDLTGVIRNVFAADAIAVAAMKKVTRRSGKRAQKIALGLCPVDEGFIKEVLEEKGLVFSPDDLFYTLGFPIEPFLEAGLRYYPPYQEYGTSRHKAQPSVTPAYNEESPRYQKEIGQEVRAALERRRRQV